MEMSGKGEGNENQSTRKGVGFKQNEDVVTVGRRKRHVAVTRRAGSAVVTETGIKTALQGQHPCFAEEGIALTIVLNREHSSCSTLKWKSCL